MRAMREIGVSAGRGGYRRSLEASRELFLAREAIASLFAIPDSSRVIFTHSATEALNMALHGILAAGDHVITTSMEHNSLVRPLYALRQRGVELTVVNAGSDGRVDPDDIRRVLRPQTRILALSHVSNVCGAIQPVREISAIAREAGALLLLDAAQSAGCLPLDVGELGVDLLAAPGHKGLLGPQGTGFLYVAQGIAIRPFLYGGTGSSSSAEEQPDLMPEGFEAGTHNLPGIAGLRAGVDFIRQQGVATVAMKEQTQAARIVECFRNDSRIRLFGPIHHEFRTGVLSFAVNDMDAASLAFMLDQTYDIAVRPGLHCAPLAHRTLGTFPAGTVRVSPGWFTTDAEITVFCDAVAQCVK